MTLTEQTFTQAMLLAGPLEPKQEALLKLLCAAVTASLNTRLRSGVTPEDCKADFVAAASLYALAAMTEMDKDLQVEQFTAGDLTLRRKGTDAAVCCLRYQAELLMLPYVNDRFAFQGV